MKYTLELPLTPSNSHHHDYSIFSRESQPTSVNVTGWGVARSIYILESVRLKSLVIFTMRTNLLCEVILRGRPLSPCISAERSSGIYMYLNVD